MQTEGVQVVCDKCGKTEFFKSFEEWDDSKWERLYFAMNGMDICPDCVERFEEFLSYFLFNFEGF